MLQITIPATEQWDGIKEEFNYTKEQTLQLEHSLISLSKWESKYCKSFLENKDQTHEEFINYVRCMTITQNVDPFIYYNLSKDNIEKINDYINAPMTATYFSEDKSKGRSREIVTSELIYYWMINANIPFECQKWHLNRLLTLIKVCGVKNSKPVPKSRNEIMRRNSSLNAARRQRFNTRG